MKQPYDPNQPASSYELARGELVADLDQIIGGLAGQIGPEHIDAMRTLRDAVAACPLDQLEALRGQAAAVLAADRSGSGS